MVLGGEFEVRGKFEWTITTMSGCIFVGIVKGDVTGIQAVTGSHISLEHGGSDPSGHVIADSGASIKLLSGKVVREQSIPPGGQGQ